MKTAGGDKQAVREAAWKRLEEARAAAFPGARGRIPNFKGAGEAARRVTPEEVIRPRRGRRRQPAGVLAGDLTAALRAEVPVLGDLGF